MFDYLIGAGQGGSRIAKLLSEEFGSPSCYLNLADVDFKNFKVSPDNILVFKTGGTGRDPEYGEKLVRHYRKALFQFLNVAAFLKRAKYVGLCVGGGGGSGSGFMFPVLDYLLKRGKEVLLIYTLPEDREGLPVKPNALRYLNRIIVGYLGKGTISCLLVDNEYCARTYGRDFQQFDYWGQVNLGVVFGLKRFWMMSQLDKYKGQVDIASGYKALDQSDLRRVVFGKGGYIDVREATFEYVDSNISLVRGTSLVFDGLDIGTAKRYVVSVGLPDFWKRDGALDFIESVFEAVDRLTGGAPDIVRCSYFNKRLTKAKVHLLVSGLAWGKGLDRRIKSAEKDLVSLRQRNGVRVLNLPKGLK